MATKNQGAAPTAIGLSRYVHVGFLLAGVVVWYVASKIIDLVWNLLWASNDLVVFAIAAVIAGGATLYAYRHPQLSALAKEIATELSKVTWPTRKETSAFTVTVIVTTIIAAIILGFYDAFWSMLTGLVYR